MISYRLAIEQYKDDLTGTGAKLYGGRWNSKGLPALYCAEHISLAVLEILTRTGLKNLPLHYYLIKISIPDKDIVSISKLKLKKEWQMDLEYSQWMGNEFLKSKRSLVLKIPSAVIDEEHNYIVNPMHPDFRKVRITSSSKFTFDKRLLSFV